MDGVDLRVVARRQRWLVWMTLAAVCSILVSCLPLSRHGMIILLAAGLFRILLHLSLLVGTVLILNSMRTRAGIAVICAISMLVPFVNFIVLVFVNQRATRMLRRAGLCVGLVGVRDEDAERIMNPHLCRRCGYNLTGNVSGRCPECGLEIPKAQAVEPANGHTA